jgi:hypothetical protein
MELLIDVEDTLHKIVARIQVGERAPRIAKGLRIDRNLLLRVGGIDIHAEPLRGTILLVHLHARLVLVGLAEHQNQVPVQRCRRRHRDFNALGDSDRRCQNKCSARKRTQSVSAVEKSHSR